MFLSIRQSIYDIRLLAFIVFWKMMWLCSDYHLGDSSCWCDVVFWNLITWWGMMKCSVWRARFRQEKPRELFHAPSNFQNFLRWSSPTAQLPFTLLPSYKPMLVTIRRAGHNYRLSWWQQSSCSEHSRQVKKTSWADKKGIWAPRWPNAHDITRR